MKFSTPLLLAALAPMSNAQTVISVHGSGTTNPSKCYWHIMDTLQVQTKLPVKMTYRAVGSSTGQAEFLGDITTPDNHFGSGDIPFGEDDFNSLPANSMLHLPIVLGSISFFHSVPTGDEKLNLSPCVLAKILNRDITDWTDPEILEENPNLSLPSPYPINVAHRVQGSSSTKSITSYLHQVCPNDWPESLVGSTIDWKTDTVGCEGSGGMTDCITGTPGTIGYIESGHGHSEGLQEIELKNKDGNFISSLEAAREGGIMAATDNAGLPTELDGPFYNVNLLNAPGDKTYPIVALSYVYVRKDLSFMPNSASRALLKAFLKALYTDEYITECEEEFGFVRVSGDLRQKALDEIEALDILDANQPEFSFEFNTAKRTGQGDYVISAKRQSYSEAEQGALVDLVASLQKKVDSLNAQNNILEEDIHELIHGHVSGDASGPFQIFSDSEQDQQIKAAFAMGIVSMAFWVLAIIAFIVKFVLHI